MHQKKVAKILVMAFFWSMVAAAVSAMIQKKKMLEMHNLTARPMEILNERYARGEITKEEYEDKKKSIMS